MYDRKKMSCKGRAQTPPKGSVFSAKTWLVLLTLISLLLGPGPSLNGQRPKSEEAEEAQSFTSTPLAQISEASQKLTASTPNVSLTFSSRPLALPVWILTLCTVFPAKPTKPQKLFLQYGKLQLDGG
jgi:hypothetical protein